MMRRSVEKERTEAMVRSMGLLGMCAFNEILGADGSCAKFLSR